MTWEEEQSLITLTQQGAFSANEMIDMLMHPEKKKTYLLQVLKKGTQQKAARAPSKVSAQSSSRRPSKGTFVFLARAGGTVWAFHNGGAKSLAEQGGNMLKYFSITTQVQILNNDKKAMTVYGTKPLRHRILCL